MLGRGFVGGLGLVLALLVPGAAVAAEPDRLAFVSERGGRIWDLFVMELDGSPPRQLTASDTIESGPAVSPDGSTIAYSSGGELWLIGIDGSNPRRLTGHYSYKPAWAPDGQTLAFHGIRSTDDSGYGVYLINVDGTELRRITPDDSEGWRRPSFSPDGSRIAFERGNYIFTAKLDGSDAQMVGDFSPKGQPAWSPDGTRIAFVGPGVGGKADLYSVDLDGQNNRRLTEAWEADYAPAWSPDGRRIAWSANRDGNPELYVMNADGSGQTRITHDAPRTGPGDGEPSWDPTSGIRPAIPIQVGALPLLTGPHSRQARTPSPAIALRGRSQQRWRRFGLQVSVTAAPKTKLSAVAVVALRGAKKFRLPRVHRTVRPTGSLRLTLRPTRSQHRIAQTADGPVRGTARVTIRAVQGITPPQTLTKRISIGP